MVRTRVAWIRSRCRPSGATHRLLASHLARRVATAARHDGMKYAVMFRQPCAHDDQSITTTTGLRRARHETTTQAHVPVAVLRKGASVHGCELHVVVTTHNETSRDIWRSRAGRTAQRRGDHEKNRTGFHSVPNANRPAVARLLESGCLGCKEHSLHAWELSHSFPRCAWLVQPGASLGSFSGLWRRSRVIFQRAVCARAKAVRRAERGVGSRFPLTFGHMIPQRRALRHFEVLSAGARDLGIHRNSFCPYLCFAGGAEKARHCSSGGRRLTSPPTGPRYL